MMLHVTVFYKKNFTQLKKSDSEVIKFLYFVFFHLVTLSLQSSGFSDQFYGQV
jgi:hypothetical protein